MITRRLIRPLSAAASGSSWICPSCAKASPLQRTILPKLQRRQKHHVVPLAYDKTFSQEGIPGLLTPEGYQIAWTDYQDMITMKLNDLTAGEATYDQKAKDIILQYARDPMNASLFNHASMAFNNHFFFKGLSTAPMPISHTNVSDLKRSLERTFGSMETLRTTMLDTAAAMFGPGFVWLVWTQGDLTSGTQGSMAPNWRILSTYNAGTPFPEAGYRQQGLDMNTSNAPGFANYMNSEPVRPVGAFGRYSESGQKEQRIPVGSIGLDPMLCVNTWEHVWLYDFGVKGKRKFLADWWDAVDWSVVRNNMPPQAWTGEFHSR